MSKNDFLSMYLCSNSILNFRKVPIIKGYLVNDQTDFELERCESCYRRESQPLSILTPFKES